MFYKLGVELHVMISKADILLTGSARELHPFWEDWEYLTKGMNLMEELESMGSPWEDGFNQSLLLLSVENQENGVHTRRE